VFGCPRWLRGKLCQQRLQRLLLELDLPARQFEARLRFWRRGLCLGSVLLGV
jgi:hypothetical protein